MPWNDRARAIARVALCVASVLLPACYQGPEPLTPATPGSVDARLDGDWRCIGDDNDEAGGLSIREQDASHHDVRLGAPGEDEDRYVAHVSRFGDTAIANVQELHDGQPAGQWVYVRYRFLREGVLDLGLVADDALKNTKDQRAALDEIRARAGDERIYETLLVCVRAKARR